MGHVSNTYYSLIEGSFFWKTPHPAEAKGRLKSEMARRQMKKNRSFLRRMSGFLFPSKLSTKVTPGSSEVLANAVAPTDKRDSRQSSSSKLELVQGSEDMSPSFGSGNVGDVVNSSAVEAEAAESPESKANKKDRQNKKPVRGGRRFDTTASAAVANSPPKKRKKGNDGIVRTKNSAFAVSTSNVPRRKVKKYCNRLNCVAGRCRSVLYHAVAWSTVIFDISI